MTDQQTTTAPEEQAPVPDEQAPAPGQRRDRRRLRAALRWGAAVLVFGISGTATAFAVAAPDRTDLPGLRTPSDGRYAFPRLTLPPLPSGRPVPFADGNGGRHWADLRGLLLPAPLHAREVADPAARADAARDCAAFDTLYTDPDAVGRAMRESACRRGAGRSWTAADGTRTVIRLVGFGSDPEAQKFYAAALAATLKAVPEELLGDPVSFDLPTELVVLPVTQRAKAADGEQRDVARAVRFRAGELVGVVLMTNPAGVPDSAFRQVVADQAMLLG